MNVLITICARGGSKGIPGKNIKEVNGLPLIAYTIAHATQFQNFLEAEKHTVCVELSSDDQEIIQVAANHGLKSSYVRPAILASDTAGKLDVIKDVMLYAEKISNLPFDLILDLDVSAPLRTLSDLKTAYKAIQSNSEALNLFSVNKAHKNPYFNMVEENSQGFFSLSKDGARFLSRQAAPKVYEMNASFYFYKRVFFEADVLNLFERALIHEMTHESFDLDEPIDFEFFSYLVANDKLSFKL